MGNTPNKRNVTTKHTTKNKNTNKQQQIIVLEKGKIIECKITSISNNNKGMHVKIIKPSSLHTQNIQGYIDGLEISDDIKILQNLKEYYKIGSIIKAKVITKYQYSPNNKSSNKNKVDLSILRIEEEEYGYYYDTVSNNNDVSGSIVIGRINRHIESILAPSLMIDIRKKNCMVRCCITELMYNPWKDMPLGSFIFHNDNNNEGKEHDYGLFEHGKYVQIRILSPERKIKNKSIYEGTLRTIEQNNEQEKQQIPKINDIIQGYITYTNDKCSKVRISKNSNGIIYVKNMSDSYIRDPIRYLPVGKVITAKVITIHGDKDDNDASKII